MFGVVQGNECVCTESPLDGNKHCVFLHNSSLHDRVEDEHASRTRGSWRRTKVVGQDRQVGLLV